MKRIFQLICLLLAANCVAACSNTENDAPLGPIGETPAEEDPDAEHIYLWPEGNMPTITDYTVNNGNYQDDLRAGNIPRHSIPTVRKILSTASSSPMLTLPVKPVCK